MTPSPPRRLAAALLATLALAIAAAVTPPTTAPAVAQEPVAPPTVSFRGVSQTPWVTRTGTWRATLELTGAPPGSRLSADLYDRVTTRDEAVAAQYTAIDGRFRGSLPEVALDEVPAEGGRREVTLAVSLRQPSPSTIRPGWSFFTDGLRPGVYPVDVRVTDADGVEQGRIVLLLTRVPSDDEPGAAAPPLVVAPVVRLGGPPTVGPDGDETTDLITGARTQALAEGLDLADDDGAPLPLTLVPRPESIEATARDDEGAAALDRLRDATRTGQVVDGPYVDVPVSSWIQRGMHDELTRQRNRGNGILAEHLGRIDSSTWDATGGLTTETAAALWPVGVRTVLLGRNGLGTDLGPGSGPYSIDVGEGRTLAALVPDASASDALVRRDDPVLDAAALAAELSLEVPAEGPARGIVLVAPDEWPADPDSVTLLADVLLDPDAPVEAVTTNDLVDRATDQGPRAMAPTMLRDLGSYPDRLADARSRLSSLTSMVGEGDPEVGAFDQRLLLSGASSFTLDEQLAYVDSVIAVTDERFSQVVAPDRQTYTLTSSDGDLPLTLLNEHDVPVQVLIELRSGSGNVEFRDGDRRLVALQPGSNPLRIPVHARAPGDSSFDIVVRSPDGVVVLDQVRYTVRSTAVPGLGVVLSAGAAGFLVIWWARHWRRDRRARRTARSGDGPAPEAPATT